MSLDKADELRNNVFNYCMENKLGSFSIERSYDHDEKWEDNKRTFYFGKDTLNKIISNLMEKSYSSTRSIIGEHNVSHYHDTSDRNDDYKRQDMIYGEAACDIRFVNGSLDCRITFENIMDRIVEKPLFDFNMPAESYFSRRLN